MERRTVSGYIFIGTSIRYLLDSSVKTGVFGEGQLADNIEDLQRLLAKYEFHVSHRLLNPLVRLRNDWLAERKIQEDLVDDHPNKDENWQKSRVLNPDEVAEIRRVSSTVREVMLAEAAGKIAYIATDKRYTVEMLIGKISSLLGDGVYARLPKIAQADFSEAGKALAFDLPTAAAFHILRGTESVLRDFYCRVVKRNRIPEPRMCHHMVKDLRSKKNGPSSLLLDNLDSLRQHFRNPTQHPDKTYDSDEAQDLLALAIDSVNRMTRYLLECGR